MRRSVLTQVLKMFRSEKLIKYQLFCHSSKSIVIVQVLLMFLTVKTAADGKAYTMYK